MNSNKYIKSFISEFMKMGIALCRAIDYEDMTLTAETKDGKKKVKIDISVIDEEDEDDE